MAIIIYYYGAIYAYAYSIAIQQDAKLWSGDSTGLSKNKTTEPAQPRKYAAVSRPLLISS